MMTSGRTRSATISRRYVLRGALALATAGSGLALVSCGIDDSGQAFTVEMLEMAFEPAEITVPVGSTINWVNESSFVHTVTTNPNELQDPSLVSTPDGSVFDSGNLASGDRWSLTFDTPGTVRYCCAPHELAGMTGLVIVEG